MLNNILALSILIFVVAFAHGKDVTPKSTALNQQKGKKTVQKNQNSQNAANISAGDNARITVQQGLPEKAKTIGEKDWAKVQIKIDRVLEDAELELQELRGSHARDQSDVTMNMAERGITYSSIHIEEKQKVANSYKSKVDDCLRFAKRGIEDIHFDVNVTDLDKVPVLSTQYKRFEDLQQKGVDAKNYFQYVVDESKKVINLK